MVVCHLTDAPKSSDIPQIKHYVKQNFDCKVDITNKALQITGYKFNTVKKWVKEKLEGYLRDDFPDFWKDSLQMFMDNVQCKVYELDQYSKIW